MVRRMGGTAREGNFPKNRDQFARPIWLDFEAVQYPLEFSKSFQV